MTAPRRVVVQRLSGLIGYEDGLRLQHRLVQRRKAGALADTLLLLEHAPVFTLGRLQASAANVLAALEALAAAGASVVQSDRGGNVTFHGPGQLVAYPILDLAAGYRRDLHWYVERLEDVMIGTAAQFGVSAVRGAPGHTGVWVGERKIGAIGVRVQRWLSSHGVALNADVDLSFFDMIVPCGLHEAPQVTSLSRELGRTVSVGELRPRFEAAFAEAFECELVDGAHDESDADLELSRVTTKSVDPTRPPSPMRRAESEEANFDK